MEIIINQSIFFACFFRVKLTLMLAGRHRHNLDFWLSIEYIFTKPAVAVAGCSEGGGDICIITPYSSRTMWSGEEAWWALQRPYAIKTKTPLTLLIISTTISTLCAPANALQHRHVVALDLAAFALPEELLVDTSNHGELQRRQNARRTPTTLTTQTTAASTASIPLAATPTVSSSTTLPSPFDSSLGNNFTEPSCPNFIQEFISTPSFQSCMPFSLLLQTSDSFFEAQKSSLLLTETLDAACSADFAACSNYLSVVATNLTSILNCRDDYALGNPTVVQALNGLLAYPTLFQASCLHNPSTSAYCAVDAFTNTSSPTDSYVYYLPLGTNLPGGSVPTCDQCLQNTMAIFQKASANQGQPIRQTYASAAAQINIICGPRFTNASIPVAMSGAGMTFGIGFGGVGTLVLAVAVALWLI